MKNYGMSGKRTLQKGMIFLLVAVLTAAVLCALAFLSDRRASSFAFDAAEDFVELDGVRYRCKNDLQTFLLIGLDEMSGESSADSYTNNQEANYLVLFSFDNKSRSCSVLQIDTETMSKVNVLDIAGNKTDVKLLPVKFAHTFGKGGAVSSRNVVDSVSSLLLGNRINHYLSFSTDVMVKLNDFAGGVEVVALEDLVLDGQAFAKGDTVALTGEQAVSYIGFGGGEFDQLRQKQYMSALFDKLVAKSKNDATFAFRVLQAISGSIESDRSVNQLLAFAKKMSEYEFVMIENISGDVIKADGITQFHPDAASLKRVAIELFYEPVAN